MKSNTIYWLGLKFIFSGQIAKLKSVSARFVHIELLPLRSVGYVVGTVAYITDQRVFQKQNVMSYIFQSIVNNSQHLGLALYLVALEPPPKSRIRWKLNLAASNDDEKENSTMMMLAMTVGWMMMLNLPGEVNCDILSFKRREGVYEQSVSGVNPN